MANPKNAYLARRAAAEENLMKKAQSIYNQYMIDTLQITLHEQLGWGYDRIMRISNAWAENRIKYRDAVEPSQTESDYVQEQIERIMVQITHGDPDKYIPWVERYPHLKLAFTVKKGR